MDLDLTQIIVTAITTVGSAVVAITARHAFEHATTEYGKVSCAKAALKSAPSPTPPFFPK